MLKTLVEAIVLVVIVIFIFLQSWRSTMIPAITIPVSLVGTFAFVKLFGFSINTLTLFGIILATGIVVDDAIVVIENIERHIQEYKVPARQAAVDAMGEVLGAVIATALVLIAVFVPIAFFPGTTGRLYEQFALTIAFAVALSAFNAVTLTPALAGAAARPRSTTARAGSSRGRARRSPPARTATSASCSGGMRVAVGAGRWSSSWRWALTYWVVHDGARAFVPEEDQGYFIIQVQAPAGRSLEYTGDDREAGREDPAGGPGRRWACSRSWASASAAPRRTRGSIFVAPEAVRRSAGAPSTRSRRGARPAHARQLLGDPGRDRRAVRAAVDSRASSRFGGFEFEVLDQTRRRHQHARGRRLRA